MGVFARKEGGFAGEEQFLPGLHLLLDGIPFDDFVVLLIFAQIDVPPSDLAQHRSYLLPFALLSAPKGQTLVLG
jgi:hypothetical protein